MILDYRTAHLSEEWRALCDYAIKLTLTPGEMDECDVEQLREFQWDDGQIHLAIQVIAYFNYINRIADGLGVDNEIWMELDDSLTRDKWLAAKHNWRK